MAHVAGIHIYPIKSCGGISVDEAVLEPGGLRGDRRWMIVDQAGRFVTQRSHPELCHVRLEQKGSDRYLAADANAAGGSFELPRDFSDGNHAVVEVWSSTVNAIEHAEGSAFFSSFLKGAYRLVHVEPSELRQVNPRYADAGDRVGFADGYPLLLTSESSLAALAGEVDLGLLSSADLEMERFRPNVVISGWEPWEEETASIIELGNCRFDIPKLCERCVMTTVNPRTAEKSKEPLKTLARLKRWNGGVWFGANLIHRQSGVLRVGDQALIAGHRAHPSASS